MEIEIYEQEPVAKNPLDSLPKSTMRLDDCKRLFNDSKAAGSTNYFSTQFLEQFDSTGYSLYRSHYKYCDDFVGRPDFVNKNTVTGFAQMLKSGTKYIFGTLILQSAAPSLCGYWILRGSEPIPEVFDDFYEYNTWEKLEATTDVLCQYDSVFFSQDSDSIKCIVL